MKMLLGLVNIDKILLLLPRSPGFYNFLPDIIPDLCVSLIVLMKVISSINGLATYDPE